MKIFLTKIYVQNQNVGEKTCNISFNFVMHFRDFVYMFGMTLTFKVILEFQCSNPFTKTLIFLRYRKCQTNAEICDFRGLVIILSKSPISKNYFFRALNDLKIGISSRLVSLFPKIS